MTTLLTPPSPPAALRDEWYPPIAARVAAEAAISMSQVLSVVLQGHPDPTSTDHGKRAARILIALGFTRKRRAASRRYYWQRVAPCATTAASHVKGQP